MVERKITKAEAVELVGGARCLKRLRRVANSQGAMKRFDNGVELTMSAYGNSLRYALRGEEQHVSALMATITSHQPPASEEKAPLTTD